jgi:hypothetical protein
MSRRLEKLLPPGVADDNSDIPPAVQQQMLQQQQLIQQLTETLQKETQLADHEQMMLKAKLQIAEMDQQTELLKHKATLEHQTNILAFQEELKNMSEQSKIAHDLLNKIAKHNLDKDLIITEAKADMAKESHKAVTSVAKDAHTESIKAPEIAISVPTKE